MADINEASFALETYYHYIRGWEVAIKREYEVGPETAEAMFQLRQETLPSFIELRKGGSYSPKLTSEYCRAKLTLIAMKSLPVSEFPYLAPTANLWLPVQAYYAINAMGNAMFIAQGGPVPGNHTAFRRAFSQNIIRLLPFPFNALCSGGPMEIGFSFKNIKVTPNEVQSLIQLKEPEYSDCHKFVGKSLSTTRDRTLMVMIEEYRKTKKIQRGRKRANLTQDEHLERARVLHDTSIADFLYRMRIRANYDSSEMYLEAFNNVQDAVRYYRSLLYITTMLINGLQTIISRKIGKQNMAELEARLPS